MFQSTPVIADGRIPRLPECHRASACFNPRPSLLTGESQIAALSIERDTLFQSTPVIADGRIIATEDPTQANWVFQSTPVIADGRIAAGRFHVELDPLVSIHARHC